MKIDDAIKFNEQDLISVLCLSNPKRRAVTLLNIEALKAVKSARANNYWTPIPDLPGETEE